MRTCQAEKPETAIAAIKALLPAQYEETGDPTTPLEPHFPLYEQLHAAGALICLVVREGDEPVAYAIGVVHMHPNSCKMKIATIPTYYVKPVQGRVHIQRALLKEVASRLAKAGAQRVRIEANPKHFNGRLLEKMGYTPIAVTYEIDVSALGQEKLSA